MKRQGLATAVVAIVILALTVMAPTSARGLDVSIDIKPGGCPNPLVLKGFGKVPVAILGTDSFDVGTINPDSLVLTRPGYESVTVLPVMRTVRIEDVATPFVGAECECAETEGDLYDDLVLKFRRRQVIEALGLADEDVGVTVPLILTGELNDGTPISGQDCVWIKKIKAQAKFHPRGKARLKTDEFGHTKVKVRIKGGLQPNSNYDAAILDGCPGVEIWQLNDLVTDEDGVGVSETLDIPLAIDLSTWHVSVDGGRFCAKVELKQRKRR